MNRSLKKLLIFVLIIFIFIVTVELLDLEERILKIIYPIKYTEYVYEHSRNLIVDPMLTFAIIKTESNFNEKAESKSGAIGLMQLMENTAKEQARKLKMEYNKEMLYEPYINLKLGLNYFNSLLDYYNQNYILAFASYNAGLGNVQKWIEEGIIKEDGSDIENIPFKETNLYVRKIIKTYQLYKMLYE